MTNIIAWPPVGVVGSRWTRRAPVSRSQFAFSGKRAVSSDGPARIFAAATVSALALDRSGAGYSEALLRLLDGGINLVRLWSWPVNWHLDAQRGAGRLTRPTAWTAGAVDLDWTAGAVPLHWFSGPVVQGAPLVDGLGFHAIALTGLPPSQVVVRAGEFLRSYAPGDSVGVVAQAVNTVWSDAAGAATVRLFSALPAGTISIGDAETAVFEITNDPASLQPMGANWTIAFEFRQVLAGEIEDPVEVNPWF